MKKAFLSLCAALVALFLFSAPSFAAETMKLEEHSIGKANAPIVIEEYASLTCSHCAEFFETIFPKLKKDYIDTGKVRYVFRDFPMDGLGLKASALAHCMPKEQFFPFLNVLFKNIRTWILNPEPEKILLQYAKLGGLSDDRASACLMDVKLLNALAKERMDATSKYDINATPTFILNKGEEKIVGAQELDAFKEAISKIDLAQKH